MFFWVCVFKQYNRRALSNKSSPYVVCHHVFVKECLYFSQYSTMLVITTKWSAGFPWDFIYMLLTMILHIYRQSIPVLFFHGWKSELQHVKETSETRLSLFTRCYVIIIQGKLIVWYTYWHFLAAQIKNTFLNSKAIVDN